MDRGWVEQKPINKVDDCDQRPSCYFSFLDLNRMRETTYYVLRSWVPRWLWAITPHFAKPWLTKQTHGDLTPEGIEKHRESHAREVALTSYLDTWLRGEGD